MRHSSSVLFSPNIKYFRQKDPIKVQILRLWSAESEFAKFLISFFKAQVSFSSNLVSFFSVMIHNSSVLFWLKFNILFTNLRLVTVRIKTHQIPYVIFGTKSQFIFKFCTTLQSHEAQLSCTVPSKTSYALDKRIPSK